MRLTDLCLRLFMHSYIEHLNARVTALPLPPEPSDPSWEDAFDSGNEQQRRNIATHWLWMLNNRIPNPDEESVVAWLAPYARMYAKVGLYVKTDDFTDRVFKGTIEDVIKLEASKLSWISESASFIYSLKHAWFEEPDNPDAFAKLITYIQASPKNARAAMQAYYPILQYLAWQHVKHDNDVQSEWLPLAVAISTQCGIDKVSTTNPFTRCNIDVRGADWHTLAYSAMYGVKPKKRNPEAAVERRIQMTPLMLRLETFSYLLDKVFKFTTPGKHSLVANTELNPTASVESNLYPMLRRFIPECSKVWDVAEGLGVPVFKAFEEALKVDKAKANIGDNLPRDFSL